MSPRLLTLALFGSALHLEATSSAEKSTSDADPLSTKPVERRPSEWTGSENRPRFSPNGRWLAFDVEVDGQTDGAVGRRTDAPSIDRGPAWPLDGWPLAHVATVEGDTELFVLSADGRRPTFPALVPQRDLWVIEAPPLPWFAAPKRKEAATDR